MRRECTGGRRPRPLPPASKEREPLPRGLAAGREQDSFSGRACKSPERVGQCSEPTRPEPSENVGQAGASRPPSATLSARTLAHLGSPSHPETVAWRPHLWGRQRGCPGSSVSGKGGQDREGGRRTWGPSPGRCRSSGWRVLMQGPSRDARKQPENTSRDNVLEVTRCRLRPVQYHDEKERGLIHSNGRW